MPKISIIFTLFIIFSGCTSKVQEASIDNFAKANELKAATESIQIANNIAIQNLIQRKNSIEIQGRTLTTKELSFIDSVNSILGEQEKFQQYLTDINKSENAYEPNGKELLYLNEQANQLTKQIQKNILKLKE